MKNLFKALAGFQQEVPAIHEGTKGYGYTYADLKTIFKVINPIMAKHNLGFTQLVQGDAIKTIIFHTESGENIMSKQYKQLYRSRQDRMIGGVCGGLGEYFGIDPTLVRILFVFGAFLGVPGALALVYLVMLILVPQDQLSEPAM